MKNLSALSLQCPQCQKPIELSTPDALGCAACGAEYKRLQNGTLVFTEVHESITLDEVDRLKTIGKRFAKLYNVMIDLVSPVFPQPTFERRKFLKEINSPDAVILNLGSGASDFGDAVINVDFYPYAAVNVVCSIDSIPLQDNSVDAIVNIAVLEHVPNPQQVIAEFLRILKPGGQLYCFIPFIQGFHASPWDFQRYTKRGMEVQFKDFDVEWIHTVGPTSGMLWVVQEWIAMVLSFGSKKLHTLIWLLVMGLTWPLKFIDSILKFHPRAENIASGFSVRASKPIK